MSTSQATGFSVGADINPFEAAMRKMVEAARGGQEGVGNALGSLATGPLAGLKTAFAAISSLLAGGFVKGAIDETAKMTENAMDLGRALGISTNDAKVIQIAMEDIGASTGEYEGAAKGMVRQLKENEAEMNKMGLATRDTAGNLRPMNELVIDGSRDVHQHHASGYCGGACRAQCSYVGVPVCQEWRGRSVGSHQCVYLQRGRTLARPDRDALESDDRRFFGRCHRVQVHW